MRRVIALILSVVCVSGYTLNTGTKTGISDGSYSDVTNILTTVIARNESDWVLTCGMSGVTNTWDMSSADYAKLFTTNRITLRGPGASTNSLWCIKSTGSANAFSIANSTTEFGHGVRSENAIRMAYIKFTTTGSSGSPILIRRGVGKRGFRIDHCVFDGAFPDRGIYIGFGDNSNGGPGPYGLIDHCNFISTNNNYQAILVGTGNDAHNWDSTAMSFGTEEVVGIEDSIFYHTGSTAVGVAAIDTDFDSRFLARRNSFIGWSVVIHGKDSGTHSCSQIELLDNYFHVPDFIAFITFLRGGTGYIRGNSYTFDTPSVAAIHLVHYKACDTVEFGAATCNVYPCDEQIGRGIFAGSPGSLPMYFSGNTYSGIDFGVAIGYCDQDASFIQDGRDFFSNTVKPGYAELAYPHPLIALTESGGGGGGGTSGGGGGSPSSVYPPISFGIRTIIKGAATIRTQ